MRSGAFDLHRRFSFLSCLHTVNLKVNLLNETFFCDFQTLVIMYRLGEMVLIELLLWQPWSGHQFCLWCHQPNFAEPRSADVDADAEVFFEVVYQNELEQVDSLVLITSSELFQFFLADEIQNQRRVPNGIKPGRVSWLWFFWSIRGKMRKWLDDSKSSAFLKDKTNN